MYLNLIHNGKKYIYETGNKLNIGHLKEITENILKSKKNIMQIVYDNPSIYHKYINPDDKTYLRDLIPKGQKKAKFSIRLNAGNSTTNLKFIKNNHKSLELNKDDTKKIFGNFSYMFTAQKKFNTMITYKYNELLIEIRELIRKINETYDEIYKEYEQSNINYSKNMSQNNKNDINIKMKQVTEFEFQIFKFIEKEKWFFSQLNFLIKQCSNEQNGKIIISNKAMKDLYKYMFKDNNINFKYDLNEKDYNSNIIENPFKNGENKLNIIEDEDELIKKKLFKTRKKTLHSLSSLNINNNFSDNNFSNKNNNSNLNFNTNDFNENTNNIIIPKITTDMNNNINNNINSSKKGINRSNSKLMISTEIGPDGVQRGKIVLFSNEKKKKKVENEKKEKMNKDEEADNDENNNLKLNLIKDRLSNRNSKHLFGLPQFKTKEDIRKSLSLFSMEKEKEEINKLKINNTKNSATNMNKELNEDNNDKKENKDITKNSKSPSIITANENNSDSTAYLNKKNTKNSNNSKEQLNKIEDNDINKEKEKANEKGDNKEINNNDNKEEDKNENKDNKDNNNNTNKNNENIDNHLNLNLDFDTNEETKIKKKKKERKKRKKRRSSSEENEESSDNIEKEEEKEKKKEKKKKNNEIDSENNKDSKESESSNKGSNKDLFDLHLLKNLSLDKDNPYKKKVSTYGNGIKKIKENELIKPELPESDESEEEKKKLALFKKKKKNHIKNKYDFLI